MEAKRLEERIGEDRLDDTSVTSVRSVFQGRSAVEEFAERAYRQVRVHRPIRIALITSALLVVLAIGYAIGGGLSSNRATDGAALGDVFITTEQADLLRQQTIDLQEALRRAAIAEGEAAFLRSQMTAITDEADALRRSHNAARVELGIVVEIYEECLERLYPANCIESARSSADAFLTEFYPEHR